MKNFMYLAAFVTLAFLAGRAQAPVPQGVQLSAVSSLAQCNQPSANNGLWLVCPVIGSGVYSSINGSAYTLLGSNSFPANCPQGTVGPSGITFGANCK